MADKVIRQRSRNVAMGVDVKCNVPTPMVSPLAGESQRSTGMYTSAFWVNSKVLAKMVHPWLLKLSVRATEWALATPLRWAALLQIPGEAKFFNCNASSICL